MDSLPLITTDYLIIGAGIAGLSVARGLAGQGETLVISKGDIQEGNTKYAQGGIAAAMKIDDSTQAHFEDTITAGGGLCDERAVEILVEEGVYVVKELIKLGASFDQAGGQLQFGKEGAHRHRRILHVGDATGKAIQDIVMKCILESKNVKFHSNMMVICLVKEKGECVGCVALDEKGKPVLIKSKATIVASGGCCQVYAHNTNSYLSAVRFFVVI